MSDSTPICSGRKLSDFFCHLVEMPRWHKRLLILASVLLGSGVLGQGASYFSATPTRAAQREATANSSYVRVDDQTTTKQADPTLTQKISPHATKVGVSFIAAFVIGWLARAFVKLVTGIVAAGASIMLALSYFRVINVNFSSAQDQYTSAVHWATGQGYYLVSSLLSHLPSSTSSAVGAWVGFRRR